MEPTNNASVHRFRDAVAVSFPGKSPTFYLTEGLARQLSEELGRVAADVRTTEFTRSKAAGLVTLDGTAAGDSEPGPSAGTWTRDPETPALRKALARMIENPSNVVNIYEALAALFPTRAPTSIQGSEVRRIAE